jgi:octaprenyl-diphosphate synthase
VKKSGGIEFTINKMHDYKTKALTILNNFEDSDYKSSLIKMIDYVVERKI